MIREIINHVLRAIGLSRVATITPATSRGGRPRKYHQDRPATDAEYARASRARRSARQETRQETSSQRQETRQETSPLKEEEKKERAGAPISKDWRPDPDGVRFGKEVFGDRFEAELADHVDYCLKTDFRCHDHDANWRRRCRALQRNPQLRLDLHGPQLDVVGVVERKTKRSGWRRRNRSIADAADELVAYARQREGMELAAMRDVTPTSAPASAPVTPRPSDTELDAQFERHGLKHLRLGNRKEASG